MIFDSLDIILTTNDDQKQAVKWSLLESTDQFTVIKLDFANPNSLSQLDDEPTLKVTFWGVEFF
jgi:hypothetical protein